MQRFGELFESPRQIAARGQRDTKVVPQVGVPGCETRGFSVLENGFIEFPKLRQDARQVMAPRPAGRFELDGARELLARVFVIALVPVNETQPHMKIVGVRCAFELVNQVLEESDAVAPDRELLIGHGRQGDYRTTRETKRQRSPCPPPDDQQQSARNGDRGRIASAVSRLMPPRILDWNLPLNLGDTLFLAARKPPVASG